MTGVSIAIEREWHVILDYYGKEEGDCRSYPFGSFFMERIDDQVVLFYRTGARKVNASAAAQYMIGRFGLKNLISVGTCAGIDERYHALDIILPDRAAQYDTMIKEIDDLLRKDFVVDIDLTGIDPEALQCGTGLVGSADKAVVMWADYLELKENGITVADTESAAIAYVCKKNGVRCILIRGITDFPVNERLAVTPDPNQLQIDAFLRNIPVILHKILDDILRPVLRALECEEHKLPT